MLHVPDELCSRDIPARVTTDNTGVRSSLPSTSRPLTTYSYLSFAVPFFLWLLLNISFSHLPNPLSVTPHRQVITYGDNTFFRNDDTPKRQYAERAFKPVNLGTSYTLFSETQTLHNISLFSLYFVLLFIFYGSSNFFIVRNSYHEKLIPVASENYQHTATKRKNFETP